MISKKLYLHIGVDEAYADYKKEMPLKDSVEEVFNTIESKMKRPDLLGKTLLVTQTQFPNIHKIVTSLAEYTDIDVPEVFVFEDFFYGIESYGMSKYWIEISAKTIRDFTEDELMFLFAREFYKIKYGYTYQSMLMNQICKVYETIPTIGDTVSKVTKNKYNHWSRLENFTADNFAYLYCKNIRACINSIVALVLNSKSMLDEIDMKSFIAQASNINKLDDRVSNFTKADETMPYAPMRVESLLAYIISKRGMQARREM